MRDIITLAHLTLVEARRRRIVFAGAACALAFLVVFSIAVVFAHREMLADRVSFVERQGTLTAITLVGFMAANFLSVIFAILLPIDTLSGEIDSGVVQTLATKPIDRAQIVLGKWAGHLILALGYVLLLSAGILLTIRVVGGLTVAGAPRALPLLMLEITLSLTVAVAGGARFSTVTNAIAAVGFYGVSFIGGFVEQIGGFSGITSMRTIGIIVSLISPADSMWRLAAHYMEPEILRSTGALAFGASVPSPLMVWWAAGFTLLTLLYSIAAFRRRAL
ncbi:MAG TPA: ABC transporter permease subunit [Vicinamibacterales bacterium]|jgi:ABC-type transport system involved in multi-copper enzyme maturation permease subunit|nr:ABC transporter permease subunit [Vicinamibacterales bacterium]